MEFTEESEKQNEQDVTTSTTSKVKKRRRRKKKSKKANNEGDSNSKEVSTPPDDTSSSLQMDESEIAKNLAETQAKLKEMMMGLPMNQEQNKTHKFWNTQPVVQDEEEEDGEGASSEDVVNGPIDVKTVEEVRVEPYGMPDGYEWATMNVGNERELEDIYTLLTNNYVEDDEAMFRFDYSPAFLVWALTPPHYSSDLHIGVRAERSGKLVGFISGVPANMIVNGAEVPMVEINFLCVHKKLRSKRLAPVLIKEVTRRVNLTGVWQAVYTAGVKLPRPVTACRYFHRNLNPRKLVDIGFSHISSKMTMSRMIKLNRLPDTPSASALRPMEHRDISQVTSLLNSYLTKFKLHQVFSEEEIEHILLPRDGIVQTYVNPAGSQNDESKSNSNNNRKEREEGDEDVEEISDFFSFYFLNSHVMKHDKHDMLYAVYSYYTVSTSMTRQELIRDALIIAKQQGVDVFNCLNLQDNQTFLDDLRFGRGDGNLHYYLFNWSCETMEPSDIGLILL